jgi:hypothetical protein
MKERPAHPPAAVLRRRATSPSIQTNPRRENHPMLNPVTAAPTRSQLADTDEAVLAFAVTTSEPDRDVPDDELAWWLLRQERMEIRA